MKHDELTRGLAQLLKSKNDIKETKQPLMIDTLELRRRPTTARVTMQSVLLVLVRVGF